MLRSIRWRLVTSYVLLTLFAVGSVGLLAMWGVKRYAQQQEIRSLSANAEAVAQQAFPLIWPQTSPTELAQLAEAASFFGNVRVRILDSQGKVLADSGEPSGPDEFILFLLPEEIAGIRSEASLENWILGVPSAGDRIPSKAPWNLVEVLKQLPPGTSSTVVRRIYGPWGNRFSFETAIVYGKAPDGKGILLEDSGPRSQRQVKVPVGQADLPAGYVELSAGTDFGAEALATARRAFFLAGGAAVILAGLLGLVMGRRISAPLISLTETATRMSAGDFSVRAPLTGQDETGKLAAQFNQMAGQLQASFDQLAAERDSLRRFIADASHELRTPITALKNFNDLLQGAAADDPQARAEFLTESQAQIERLEWITNNLLDLSRLDAGLVDLDLRVHDLRELFEAAAVPFKGLAAEQRITLLIRPPASPLEIQCDRERLEMAISNLLDNALKFTPQGGTVETGGEGSGQGVRIWVQDSGPGIPPEDLPHIFERFYRGRVPGRPGSGLGLSIAQSVVQAHRGKIIADSHPGAGARFTIELPGETTTNKG